jgi:SAM-dependent methyltransferase
MYEQVQNLVGVNEIRRRLAPHMRTVPASSTVLDIGGGTGSLATLLPASCAYLCLDLDPVKLRGFLAKRPGGVALCADAAAAPIPSRVFDLVLCTAVTHHLGAQELTALLAESARLLKQDGRMILMDAVWESERRMGRWLWKYDRGSFPRTAESLRSAIEERFTILHWESFGVSHAYFICVAGPRDWRLATG